MMKSYWDYAASDGKWWDMFMRHLQVRTKSKSLGWIVNDLDFAIGLIALEEC